MVAVLLAEAVKEVAVPVQPVGFSWTAIIGVIQTLVVAALGGGGLWGLFRGIGLLLRILNERSKQDDEKDAALRREMAEQNDRLLARISKLETDISEERRRCDEEIAALRRTHADEVRDMRAQIDGLQRVIVQLQISTGAVLNLPATGAIKAAETLDRLDKLQGGKE